jgi:hypothetical protein
MSVFARVVAIELGGTPTRARSLGINPAWWRSKRIRHRVFLFGERRALRYVNDWDWAQRAVRTWVTLSYAALFIFFFIFISLGGGIDEDEEKR